MSPHQMSALDVLKECREIVWSLSEARAGDSIKKQIRNAARNAPGIDYGTIWRCWQLRGGPKVLVRLREAKRRFVSRQNRKAKEELAALRHRLKHLEGILALSHHQASDMALEPRPRRRMGSPPLQD